MGKADPRHALTDTSVEGLGQKCGWGAFQVLRQGGDGFGGDGLSVAIAAVKYLPQFDNPGYIEAVGDQWVTSGHEALSSTESCAGEGKRF